MIVMVKRTHIRLNQVECRIDKHSLYRKLINPHEQAYDVCFCCYNLQASTWQAFQEVQAAQIWNGTDISAKETSNAGEVVEGQSTDWQTKQLKRRSENQMPVQIQFIQLTSKESRLWQSFANGVTISSRAKVLILFKLSYAIQDPLERRMHDTIENYL